MSTEPGNARSEQPGMPLGKGRLGRTLLPLVMRSPLLRRAIGVQVVFRSTGGGLIVGGLAYAALFALIPTLVLVIAVIFMLVDDPQFRQEVVDVLTDAMPAFADITDEAVEHARDLAAVGGVLALVGFFWGASGLYLNLTRAMERFFPGERISGALARLVGVMLVFIIIIGVLAAVVVAGIITVVAQALGLDTQAILAAGGAVAAFVVSTLIVYAVYRVIPSNPPTAPSARLPAVLVGAAIALMTLLYGLVSPWLVHAWQAFGVMASVFVALIWLRLVFLTMVYGAAMARYRDFTAAATILGEAHPDLYATRFALEQEAARAQHELDLAQAVERRRDEARSGTTDETAGDQP